MSTTIDKPHVLIIEDIDGEKHWHIVHPATCPWEGWLCGGCNDPFFNDPCGKHAHFWRACLTEWETNNNGLDSLGVDLRADYIDPDYVPASPFEAEWRRLKPGRYIVQATYYWSGSWYDEADSEFYIEGVVVS